TLAPQSARETRADAVDAALVQLARAAPELGTESELPGSDGAAEVLARFIKASERGDFKTAYGLLTARWRARYTPDRLAQDFAREPLAKERLARARAALERGPTTHGNEALFPVGNGRAVVVLREEDGYRVASLE